LRAWLYGIATNACLDFLARNRHRVIVEAPPAPVEVAWLQPYPDRLLDAGEAQPHAAAAAREAIGLAFLVAMQLLPAKQRATLILCDVLDWSAREVAELLDLSVAAVNSALQRARATLRERQTAPQPQWNPGDDPDQEERRLLERYVNTTERGDVAGLAGLLREEVRFSMPPEPGVWVGRDAVVGTWVQGGFGTEAFGAFRCLVTRANGAPAVACYLRRPGQATYLPLALDVLRIEGGLVQEIVTFALERRLALFDLPAQLWPWLPHERGLSLLGRHLAPRIARRVVVLPPGGRHRYRVEDWRDALVWIERGEIELGCAGRPRFRQGDLLWLGDLCPNAIHNHGPVPAVLVAVWRRPESGDVCAPGQTCVEPSGNCEGPPPVGWSIVPIFVAGASGLAQPASGSRHGLVVRAEAAVAGRAAGAGPAGRGREHAGTPAFYGE
jgi:RNA polymerase sigma-70 factor (ECF subfamily)